MKRSRFDPTAFHRLVEMRLDLRYVSFSPFLPPVFKHPHSKPEAQLHVNLVHPPPQFILCNTWFKGGNTSQVTHPGRLTAYCHYCISALTALEISPRWWSTVCFKNVRIYRRGSASSSFSPRRGGEETRRHSRSECLTG